MLKTIERLLRRLTGRKSRRRRRRRKPDPVFHIQKADRPPSDQRKHRRNLKKHRMRKRQEKAPNLQFSHEEKLSWSLKVLEDGALVGLLHASTPVSCLEVVAPYFKSGAEPQKPYRLFITCNANQKQLKLDRHVWQHVDSASAEDVLAYLGTQFEKNLDRLAERSSVTVMVNAKHEVIKSKDLFSRAFGLL